MSLNQVRHHIKLLPLFAALIVFLGSVAMGQAVKLRAQITPTCSSTQGPSAKFADIYAEGNIAVQGSYGCRGAFIYDVTNPDAPVLANHYNPIRPGTGSTNEQFLEAIVLDGRGYFGSGSGGGVYIVDLTNPTSPELLGRATSTSGGAFNSIHEMVVIDQGGVKLLIENDNSGTNLLRVINVTNPAAPTFVRTIDPLEVNWVHAMHVRGNRMFTSGWGNTTTRARTEIWDISNLMTQNAAVIGTIEDSSTPVTNGNKMHTNWSSEDGSFLYSAREIGDSNAASPGDIRVYDISTPSVPLLVKKISMADLGINASTPHNPVVMGDKLYVSWYHAGLQVFDLRVPGNPQRVGQYDTYTSAFSKEDQEAIAQFDPSDIICGKSVASGAAITGYEGAWAVFPFLGEDKVLVGDLAKGLLIVDVTQANAPPKNLVSDFDGDGRTDLSVFRPSSGDWEMETSSNGAFVKTHFGSTGDVIVPGDFDGDDKTDIAVFRPSTGIWYLQRSTAGFTATNFGLNGDIPVAADYDADGRTDIAVWRPSTGIWYIQQSTLGFRAHQWGSIGDKVMMGDFEADGKADLAVWRPSNGVWYVLLSSSTIGMYQNFGLNGDRPVTADFDGNGVTDFVIYRPSSGVWYILDPVTRASKNFYFGIAEDIPIPADYDGDAKADVAVFRPSTSQWYRLNSTNGSAFVRTFGEAGDKPSPSSVQPQ